MPLLAAVVLIILHNIAGDEIAINIEQIVILQNTKEANGGRNELVTSGAKCAIGLDNGKFVSVTETCATVRQAIDQAEKR